jgi:hypothetical protein
MIGAENDMTAGHVLLVHSEKLGLFTGVCPNKVSVSVPPFPNRRPNVSLSMNRKAATIVSFTLFFDHTASVIAFVTCRRSLGRERTESVVTIDVQQTITKLLVPPPLPAPVFFNGILSVLRY